MRLWTQLTIGFAGTAVLVVGLYGAQQLRQEEASLRAAAVEELALTATALQVGTANALRDQQIADVHEIVDALRLRNADIDALVVDPTGGLVAGSWGNSPGAALLQRLVPSRPPTSPVLRFELQGERLYLFGAFPIAIAGRPPSGTLVLVRALDDLQQDLASERRGIVLSLASLVVGLSVAGWILAYIYVHRPVRSLIGAIQAIRGGDLSAKARWQRADEFGDVITQFNAMMEELREARRRLAYEAESRAMLDAKLQRADKLVTVGQLSAGLAHEIGSPLQVLSGRARALAGRTGLPSDVTRTAEILSAQSDRITRIVAQLLTFARHSDPLMAEVQLPAPIRDVVELLEPIAARQQVQITFTAAAVPSVYADVSQIQQVAMNLLTNALRATPRGGRVSVTVEGSRWIAAAGSERPSVLVVVEDTGEGISEDSLPRVFEPFFTTGLQGSSTGLGLSIVKSIVESHGGIITLTTRIGVGTRVSIHFPVAGVQLDALQTAS